MRNIHLKTTLKCDIVCIDFRSISTVRAHDQFSVWLLFV